MPLCSGKRSAKDRYSYASRIMPTWSPSSRRARTRHAKGTHGKWCARTATSQYRGSTQEVRTSLAWSRPWSIEKEITSSQSRRAHSAEDFEIEFLQAQHATTDYLRRLAACQHIWKSDLRGQNIDHLFHSPSLTTTCTLPRSSGLAALFLLPNPIYSKCTFLRS